MGRKQWGQALCWLNLQKCTIFSNLDKQKKGKDQEKDLRIGNDALSDSSGSDSDSDWLNIFTLTCDFLPCDIYF